MFQYVHILVKSLNNNILYIVLRSHRVLLDDKHFLALSVCVCVCTYIFIVYCTRYWCGVAVDSERYCYCSWCWCCCWPLLPVPCCCACVCVCLLLDISERVCGVLYVYAIGYCSLAVFVASSNFVVAILSVLLSEFCYSKIY